MLLYSFMAVEIKGWHLKEVRQAIQHGRCRFIQEYDPSEFLPQAKRACSVAFSGTIRPIILAEPCS
jgi:hypothetical protein